MSENHRIQGIIRANADKRYNNFINTVVDLEEVWLLDGGDGYCTYDEDDDINIIVYPKKEFADYFNQGATPVMMEVHEFCRECKKMINDEHIGFAVFPNGTDCIMVSAEVMFQNLMEALEEVEDIDESLRE